MSEFWSKDVQSTELLYYSREEKFNDENKDLYFKLIHVKDGMKVLEVGCGSGHFCNMIKKYFPKCEVYGVDLDDNHIAFAKNKAMQLGLEMNYSIADINDLKFDDNSFDYNNKCKEMKKELKFKPFFIVLHIRKYDRIQFQKVLYFDMLYILYCLR